MSEMAVLPSSEAAVALLESRESVPISEPVAEPPLDLKAPELYINRELSHLQFNIRVLEQALDERHPLLERLMFLLIFSSNLDEFFEIRVADQLRQLKYGREAVGPDAMHPEKVIGRISEICHAQVERQYQILNDILFPEMEAQGIRFLRRRDWTKPQREWLRTYFEESVVPVISPVGLDPSHPFPRLVNKSLNFIVELDGKDAFGRQTGMAIIPAPRSLPRLVRLPNDICDSVGENLIFLSSMIHEFADELFPGMQVKGCFQFRITRNADLTFDFEEIEDLANTLRGELHSRKYGDAVRLEVDQRTPEALISFLQSQYALDESQTYRVNGPVNLTRLMAVRDLIERNDLRWPPFSPGLPNKLKEKDIFSALRSNDQLLLHPFQSFSPVVDLLRVAAKDPCVLAIKQTLYRTGVQSDIVNALVEAARSGKEVTVVIELRARFDEESNLTLASRLQEAGCLVVYGVVGYKCHAKAMLIIRQENNKLVRYTHLGTGNYHSGTARLYTDYSLLTADQEVGEDVHKVFQQLTGMGKIQKLKKLYNAPFTLHAKMLELIERETRLAKSGKPGRIIVKVNGLTEPKMVRALYDASRAGVQIDLIVRGMCRLRPGIEGLSENIRVRSIIGRFLEHTRVCYFGNNDKPEVFAASADWMERNMLNRVETGFQLFGKNAERMKRELDYYLKDNCQSWQLHADGSYTQNHPQEGEECFSAQDKLMEEFTR